jgi:four helix bundle protein
VARIRNAGFQETEGLGEGARTDLESVQGYPRIPQGRTLWANTSQMRRACFSIPANIAEGCGREGDLDFARFLQISMGSASELDYYLLLACDLELMNRSDYDAYLIELTEVKRMLASLIKRLRADS